MPLLHVTPNACLAFLDERLNSVGFDFLLAVDAQFLADFDFDWQSVGIPARLSLAAEPLHRFVARKDVFDAAGQAVAWVGHPVSRRRSFEENKRGPVGSAVQRGLVDAVIVPELKNLFFKLGELGATGGGAKRADRSGHGQSRYERKAKK